VKALHMEDDGLKPCPFCGCDGIEGPFPHSQLRLVWVTRCGNPSCEVEHMADSAEEACARWNRRTPPETTEVAELRRDAERYRWLRDHWWLDDKADATPAPMMNAQSPEQFDAAIGAALGEQP